MIAYLRLQQRRDRSQLGRRRQITVHMVVMMVLARAAVEALGFFLACAGLFGRLQKRKERDRDKGGADEINTSK